MKPDQVVSWAVTAWEQELVADGTDLERRRAWQNLLYLRLYRESNDLDCAELDAAVGRVLAGSDVTAQVCAMERAQSSGRRRADDLRQAAGGWLAAGFPGATGATSADEAERAYVATIARARSAAVRGKLAQLRGQVLQRYDAEFDRGWDRIADAYRVLAPAGAVGDWSLGFGVVREAEVTGFFEAAGGLTEVLRSRLDTICGELAIEPAGSTYDDAFACLVALGQAKQDPTTTLDELFVRAGQVTRDRELGVELTRILVTPGLECWQVGAAGTPGYVVVEIASPAGNRELAPADKDVLAAVIEAGKADSPVAFISARVGSEQGRELLHRAAERTMHEIGHAIVHCSGPQRDELDGFCYEPLERLDELSMAMEYSLSDPVLGVIGDGSTGRRIADARWLLELPDRLISALSSYLYFREAERSWTDCVAAAGDAIGCPGDYLRLTSYQSWSLQGRRPGGDFTILWGEALAQQWNESRRSGQAAPPAGTPVSVGSLRARMAS
ncbi:hypothetical protein GCM10009554_61990 [Kribbella koreensis]|uniref:Uncharacterized protein n=1 Tax=Kribbella koreensis TaxID=57909 RepID=A0ABP4BXD4_9ACTN